MKGKIIIINILYYFFNNNINCGCFCKKLSCKNDTRQINDEVRKENDNQKKENDEEKKKDDILKKKREKLLEKYKNIKSKNDELPENERINIGYYEEFIKITTKEERLKEISDTLDEKEKNILAIWERINKKKYEEELKKTLEDRKKECNNLLKDVNKLIEDNFTKYFKEIDIKNNIKIINDKYSKIIKKVNIDDSNEIKKAIGNLDEIKKELNNKKDGIDKLIEEDNKKDKYVCETKEEFINKFNERKNELISSKYFKNIDLINKLTADLKEDESDDYYKMYQQMTNDVFNHQIALDLQIYRYILNLEGFITALDNIISKGIKLYVLSHVKENQISPYITGLKYIDRNKYYFCRNLDLDFEELNDTNKEEFADLSSKHVRNFISEINKKENFCTNLKKNGLIDGGNTLEEIKNKFELFDDRKIKTGTITVDVKNEEFKYLRCDKKGKCGENNCVSCKLYNLLDKEGILELFLNIYRQQGEGSNRLEPLLIKRIIYDGLKKEIKHNNEFFSLKNEEKRKDFCKEISDDFRKSVMIEWALTIEFMKRFIPKYYGSNVFSLYRTFNYLKSTSNIKPDIYESSSLIGNIFTSESSLTNDQIIGRCFFTNIENVKFFKCIGNYIISPNEKTILKDDKELEIMSININEKYIKNEITDYLEYIDKLRHSNFNRNFGEGNWEEIDVPKLKKKGK